MQSTCIFCQILVGKAPASIVFQDDLVMAIMDIRPINPGHMLVIPCVHYEDLASLDERSGERMFKVGQKLVRALRGSGIRCEGVNFYLADGKAAGQDVFHVHLHVFPRFATDGFGLNFPKNYTSTPTDRDLREETAVLIRKHLLP